MEPAEYALMDGVEHSMWWYRALHRRMVAKLAEVHGRVLDAGCGTGGLLAALRGLRPDLALVGVEWDHAAARRAAEKSAASVARGSVNALPFADASFDAVVMADVLCHRAVDPAASLAELGRVLRPGGRLVINMPAFTWLLSTHDHRVHNVRRWTRGQTHAALATAGFGTIRATYWNGLLLPVMIAQRKLRARHGFASDVAAFPPWLDRSLHRVTEIEHRLPVPMPAGGSVLATAIRPIPRT